MIRLVLLAMAYAVFIGGAHAADASACYTISDQDARAFCLAKAHNDSSRCYAIQRADMRAACLAEMRSK
ncbi:MAG: hypothetical protein EPN31_04865 [Castellaniella sp.]|nr:MAG: hypothetical protein EPN31_04865 [Castellaniella sp.]